MRSIVLGAGRFGQSIANSLSLRGHSVTVVDKDAEKLKATKQRMDVATEQGLAQDPKLLVKLFEEPIDFLFAFTDDPNINLVATSIAKNIANPTTIARLEEHYFLDEKIDTQRIFHVDHAVIPELLAAEQIAKIVFHQGLYSETFFHGNALLRTFEIPKDCPHTGKALSQINTQSCGCMIGLIRRKKTETLEDDIIFPHGNDIIQAFDEVTIIADADQIAKVLPFFGVVERVPKSACIFGHTQTGITLARFLQRKNLSVRLVVPSSANSIEIAKELNDVAVIVQDSPTYEFFQQEQIATTDAFIACTEQEENNMLLCLYAKEVGCKKVIALISDPLSCRLAQEQGIDHIISPKALASDRILALTQGDKVSTYLSLYDSRAELMEMRISQESPIAGIPLSILGPKLPQEVLIAVIYDRGLFFIAGGTHILAPKNDIVVISSPKHRNFLEKIF